MKLLSLQLPANHVDCRLCGPESDFRTVANESTAVRRNPAVEVNSNPHQTHRLLRGATVGASHACDADTDLALQQTPDSGSHFAGNILAHRAGPLQDVG